MIMLRTCNNQSHTHHTTAVLQSTASHGDVQWSNTNNTYATLSVEISHQCKNCTLLFHQSHTVGQKNWKTSLPNMVVFVGKAQVLTTNCRATSININ